eukprot:1159689-Pelagomonas_calceolata.AAC.4
MHAALVSASLPQSHLLHFIGNQLTETLGLQAQHAGSQCKRELAQCSRCHLPSMHLLPRQDPVNANRKGKGNIAVPAYVGSLAEVFHEYARHKELTLNTNKTK